MASLRHTCAIIMLSNQHFDMPHLWGGWITSAKEKCSQTQISTDLWTIFERNRPFVYIEKVFDLWVQLMKNWGQKQKCCIYNFVRCICMYVRAPSVIWFWSRACSRVKSSHVGECLWGDELTSMFLSSWKISKVRKTMSCTISCPIRHSEAVFTSRAAWDCCPGNWARGGVVMGTVGCGHWWLGGYPVGLCSMSVNNIYSHVYKREREREKERERERERIEYMLHI